MRRAVRGDSGFTLFEMLIAMTIMLFVVAGIFSVFNPSQGAFQAQPEVSDMQQRLRMAVNTLHKDLVMAGAGTYSGSAAGNLTAFMAPILPYRIGTDAQGPASGVFFRSDTVSIMYVPTTASQCTIRDQMPQPSSEVKVNAQPGCPAKDPLCGFEVGMRVLIFDNEGAWDTFTITNVQSDALHLQHRDDDFGKAYGPGANIAQVAMHTYYLRADPATSQFQLMHYDGYRTDEPVVDNVVGFEVGYFGESDPPVLRKPVTDPVGPWTTYGPKPPAVGVDNKNDSWGAGENCTFVVDPASGAQVTRLAQLGPPGSLTPLTQAQLTDGPWCPDAAHPNRYDADLLRIRQVRVRLRVQTGESALRGPAGTLFARGGQGQAGDRLVPDQEIRFDVSPRNLNLGR